MMRLRNATLQVAERICETADQGVLHVNDPLRCHPMRTALPRAATIGGSREPGKAVGRRPTRAGRTIESRNQPRPRPNAAHDARPFDALAVSLAAPAQATAPFRPLCGSCGGNDATFAPFEPQQVDGEGSAACTRLGAPAGSGKGKGGGRMAIHRCVRLPARRRRELQGATAAK